MSIMQLHSFQVDETPENLELESKETFVYIKNQFINLLSSEDIDYYKSHSINQYMLTIDADADNDTLALQYEEDALFMHFIATLGDNNNTLECLEDYNDVKVVLDDNSLLFLVMLDSENPFYVRVLPKS